MFQTLSVPGFVSFDFSYQILQVFERLGWNKKPISDHHDPFINANIRLKLLPRLSNRSVHIQNCLKIRNLRSTSPLTRYLVSEESAKSICHLRSLPKMNIYDEHYFRDPHKKKINK